MFWSINLGKDLKLYNAHCWSKDRHVLRWESNNVKC